MPLWDKMETIAKKIYGASSISAPANVKKQIDDLQANGYGKFPVCVAKTQYSFSTDPSKRGAPSDHEIPIREVRLICWSRIYCDGLWRYNDYARSSKSTSGRENRY